MYQVVGQFLNVGQNHRNQDFFFLKIVHGQNIRFFLTCSFSFFDKLLNKDRVTPIPLLNLLNFPKIQPFIFFQNQICQPKYKDMDGEVIVVVLQQESFFSKIWKRLLKKKKKKKKRGKREFGLKKRVVGQFLNVGQKVGFF